MAKGNFSGISKVRRKPEAIDEFVSAANVDGKKVTETMVSSRRGKYRVDPKTGEKIALGGKVLEIPLNNEEVAVLSQAARSVGLPLATFVRSEAMKAARKSMPAVD